MIYCSARIGLIAIIFVSYVARAQVFSDNPAATAAGIMTGVIVHETGHAVTAKLLGWDVLLFRPFPTKYTYMDEDGKTGERWALGLVKVDRHGGENPWFAAMGSGATALSVLCLAPLLPSTSGFGAQALNDYLVYATFDWPAYALADSIFRFGDWAHVAKVTGVSIYWYLTAAVAESLLLNQYRLHFRNKAVDRGHLKNTDANLVAVSFGF